MMTSRARVPNSLPNNLPSGLRRRFPGRRITRALAGTLRAFRADRQGIALIEFALVVPILLIILLVGTELVNAIENRRKVVQLARTLADLTSLGDSINPVGTATMNNIFDAAGVVLAPYSATGVSMKVSAVGIPLIGVPTVAFVCSSAARNATARGRGLAADIKVPVQYQFNGSRWIYVEISMNYRPLLGSAPIAVVPGLSTAFQWKETVSWAVRGGTAIPPSTQTEVILPNGTACPGTIAG